MNSRAGSRSPVGKPAPVTHEQIAALAHEIWLERGGPGGSDIDIWLEAERQLNGMPGPKSSAQDPIPADPANPDVDSDPALNPEEDREIKNIGGGSNQSHPTALNLP